MALVTGALGSVISKLGQLLKEEYDLQTGVRKKITRLARDLESMHAVLCKVAEVPPEQLDEEVKLWARDIRELSYDMEDILDTFLLRVDGPEASDKNRFKRAAKNIGKLFSKGKVRHQIDGMIKTINEQAAEVAERHRRYKAQDIVSKPAATSTLDPRLQAMWKEVTELVGIKKPSEKLLSMLSLQGEDDESKTKMKVVSIVGAGGLGKTTLVKAVYDKLKSRFDCTAFVPVGRDPDLKKVFRDILIDLDKDKYMDQKITILDERQLIGEIREYLKDKRYFIVIDDVWKAETCERIKYALVQNNNGSKLITTTRQLDVAAQADEVYQLQPLPSDQSEKLFYVRIFGTNGTYPNNQLKEVSDKILSKCHGVPLAIITMASLLLGKTPGEWNEICKSVLLNKANRQGNQQVSDTEWILSLSYYDLPAHLKTCLLYLSAFPEDYIIDKDLLIWKWVAEGFVDNSKQGTTSLFEVGEAYFNELVNRSMIQAVESDMPHFVRGCCLHDMVLDLLRLKSQEENFLTISKNTIAGSKSSPRTRVRRLANQGKMVEQKTYQDRSGTDLRRVRTFIACGCDVFADKWLSLQMFQLLRVLALENCRNFNLEHAENLLHLRYISITRLGSDDFVLPERIGALKFLQILDIFTYGVMKEIPSSFGLLTQLICLRVGNVVSKIPNGVIEKLTSLEELQINLDKYGYKVEHFVKDDLGKLRELKVLCCSFWSKVLTRSMQSDLVDSLRYLHKIRHLTLEGSRTIAEKAIWDTLVLPRSLQVLNLRMLNFTALPSCINPSDVPNLTHLDLSVKDLDEQGLKILGMLPELRHLVLFTFSTVTITIDAADDACFRKLGSCCLPHSTTLFMLNNDSSVSFTIWDSDENDGVAFIGSDEQQGAVGAPPVVMPNLEELILNLRVQNLIRHANGSCDKLGLEYLASLQQLTVCFNCEGAFADEAEKVEATLRHVIEACPNRPTLEINPRNRFLMKNSQMNSLISFPFFFP